MSAAITDTFDYASNGTAPVPTTLASQKAVAAPSLSLNAATGWPTSTAIHFKLYILTAAGAVQAGSETIWKGTLSGTTVSNLTLKSGTDQIYPATTTVAEMMPTSAWADDLMNGILQDHAQLGYHKSLTDANGKSWLGQTATASAVNYWNNANAATNGKPTLQLAGTDSNISGSIKGKGTGVVDIDGAVPVKFFGLYDFVESGCVWSGDSYGSTRNGSMTAGFVWIGGVRVTVASVSAHAFTASKDTYIDVDNTGTLTYTEVTNNAASPALAANNLRLAIIVTAAGSIANSGSVNQGQETMVLPIASSIPYAVTDSLGNLICSRDPNRKVLGYRQITTPVTISSASSTQITGLSCPVIIPTGRKIKITLGGCPATMVGAGGSVGAQIWEGTVGGGTQLQGELAQIGAGSQQNPLPVEVGARTPGSSSVTYNAAMSSDGTHNAEYVCSSTAPAFIKVELA